MIKHQQKGMTLIGAIFILVIVSLLGQFLINITSVQRQTSILALQSARAYQTANAGLEWGIAQVVASNNCAGNTTLAPAINNFTTTVTCSAHGNFTENAQTVNVFLITSQSGYGNFGDPDYVSRTLEVKVHDLP
jgi:MSHA biogenesis protein MshP